MTSAAKDFIESFERLSTSDQREVAREILRRDMPPDYGSLSEDALVEIGAESFLELDRHEQAHDRG